MKNWKDLFIKNKRNFVIMIAVCAVVFVGAVAGIVSLSIETPHVCGKEAGWQISKAATCKSEGLQVWYCPNDKCEKAGTVESIPVEPTAHSWEAPTCEDKATCKLCKAEDSTRPALGHKYTIAATCTTPAECSRCHETTGKPLGHTEKVVEERATCDVAGSRQTVCEVCEAELSEKEEIPATGHTWKRVSAKTVVVNVDTCETCGATASDNLEYELQRDNTYAVVGVGNNRTEQIVIPTVHNGKKVSKITTQAFREYVELKSVIIIDAELIIFDEAFVGCVNLETLEIVSTGNGGNITLGRNALNGCKNLKEVILGDQVTAIYAGAFSDCVSLEKITIGENVKTVGEGAFNGCKSLKEISMPATVEFIGKNAFYSCTNLEKAYVGETITEISDGTFDSCLKLKEVNVPETVEKVGARAFANTLAIEEVVLGNAVTAIGAEAFKDSAIISINFPESLEKVEKDAFLNCGQMATTNRNTAKKMTQVSVKDLTKWCEITFENAYANPTSAKAQIVQTGVESNNGVKLTEIVIPDNVLVVNEYAFYGYDTMTALTIGKGVRMIGAFAFAECSVLKDVTYLAQYCNATEGNAFYKAGQQLTEGRTIDVTIGAEVWRVPEKLFYTFGEGAKQETYTANVGKLTFAEESPCTIIAAFAFANCGNMHTVEIGKNVKTIGEKAFSSELEESTFYNKLATVVIPDGIESIHKEAFLYCDSITTATLPGKAAAYISKAKLVNVTLTSGYVQSEAFKNAPELKTVIIGENVTQIGEQAFYNCIKLESVDATRASLVAVDDEAFAFCINLKTIDVPVLESIGSKAFYDCASMEMIVLSKDLNYIGKNAFEHCQRLKDVDFENRNDWRVSGRNNTDSTFYSGLALESTDLAGRAKAASFLTSMELYCNFSWICSYTGD